MDEWAKGWSDDPTAIDITSLLPLLRLGRLGPLIEAFRGEVVERFELTPSDYDVLTALRAAGRPYTLNPSQIYSPLRISSGGMTKILKRLENAGLVAREPNPEDGRSIRVMLTDRGLGLHDRVLRAIAAASTRLLAGLSTAEKQEIDAALVRLRHTLEEA